MRFYDAGIGRFISRDSLAKAVAMGKISTEELLARGIKLPIHPYTYADNNSVNYVDPWGCLQEYINPDIAKFHNSLGDWTNRLKTLKDRMSQAQANKIPVSPVLIKDIAEKEAYVNKYTNLLRDAKERQAKWNRFDNAIQNIVKEYNEKYFPQYSKFCPPDTPPIDPDLLKALIFSETEMGAGEEYVRDYLDPLKPSYQRWREAHDAWLKSKAGDEPKIDKYVDFPLWQLNIGRVTDPLLYNSINQNPDFININAPAYDDIFKGGSEADIKLAAAALLLKLEDVTKNLKIDKNIWFNVIKAYKGFSNKGEANANRVWNLYKEGKHPYNPENILWQK
ncbi:MAG TPA: hypothetical protein DCZ94_20440 [Lentisphaeria bacterium]|nr:MAG: hypothetical protein A2X48_15180 [Lentisphaerae bacterium GWF2_49_21]HBC89317.1 hypothetical protein [Lentisphaeria bacterium]